MAERELAKATQKATRDSKEGESKGRGSQKRACLTGRADGFWKELPGVQ